MLKKKEQVAPAEAPDEEYQRKRISDKKKKKKVEEQEAKRDVTKVCQSTCPGARSECTNRTTFGAKLSS